MIIFAAIEAAIIKRLEAASKLDILGYGLKTVDTLPADLDERLPEYIQNFPAAWAVFNGWRKLSDNGDGTTDVEARFSIVVGATSLRNEKAQRHGAGGREVGSYQLVADVAALVSQQTFGLPIGALQLGDCSPLYTAGGQKDRKASLFAVSFTCRVEVGPTMQPPLIETPGVGDFATFAVGWDAPPFTGAADLADEIHLQQDT